MFLLRMAWQHGPSPKPQLGLPQNDASKNSMVRVVAVACADKKLSPNNTSLLSLVLHRHLKLEGKVLPKWCMNLAIAKKKTPERKHRFSSWVRRGILFLQIGSSKFRHKSNQQTEPLSQDRCERSITNWAPVVKGWITSMLTVELARSLLAH